MTIHARRQNTCEQRTGVACGCEGQLLLSAILLCCRAVRSLAALRNQRASYDSQHVDRGARCGGGERAQGRGLLLHNPLATSAFRAHRRRPLLRPLQSWLWIPILFPPHKRREPSCASCRLPRAGCTGDAIVSRFWRPARLPRSVGGGSGGRLALAASLAALGRLCVRPRSSSLRARGAKPQLAHQKCTRRSKRQVTPRRRPK